MKNSAIDRLLQTFYDWDRIEKGEIIDFDLVQRKKQFPQKFENRKQIQASLASILKTIPANTAENRFVRAKIQGSLSYLKALQNQHIPFKTYIQQTMQLTPKMLSKTYLDKQLQETRIAYQKIGFDYTKKEIEKLMQDHRLTKKQIKETFINFQKQVVPKFMDWLGIHIPLDYVIEFVEKDEYWMNWIATREDGKILLRYNLHKRHDWLRGSTEYLVLHEICAHFIQASIWKKKIKEGNMNPFIGLTSVFTCEQIIFEGIAESLWYFLPFDPYSKFGKAIMLADNLLWLVNNNLHIMANSGKSEDEIYQFTKRYLPRYKRSHCKKDIKEKTENPLFRAYHYSYGIGLYHLKKMSTKLDEKQKKKFLHKIYSHPIIPREYLEI